MRRASLLSSLHFATGRLRNKPAHGLQQLAEEGLLPLLLIELPGRVLGQNLLLQLRHGETSGADLSHDGVCQGGRRELRLSPACAQTHTGQETTFVLLRSVGLDHRQRPLPGEEEVDLPLGLLGAVAAVQLVDGLLLLHSQLGPQTGGGEERKGGQFET